MANEHNLIPVRSENEAREKGRKGGIASGEARRRKKTLKAAMKDLLSMDITDSEIYNNTTALGIDVDDISYGAAIVAAMVRKAAGGDVAAFKEIRNLVGEDNDAERLKLQRKQLALQEKKLAGDAVADIPDDGFIEALKGSAQEDWSDDETTE